MKFIRLLAWAVGSLGFAFFAAAFVASYVAPGWVEQVARDAIRHEVEKQVREKVASLDEHFLARQAQVLARGHAKDIEQARRQLEQQLPERLAQVIAEMGSLDCECRKRVEAGIRDGLLSQIATAAAARERLTELIRTKYLDIAAQVLREFRIFTGTHALVFGLLLGALVRQRRAGVHLLPAAALLVVAGVATAYFYLFHQNWLHTLVFNDFVGFGYVAYLGLAFALLSDVAFNRASVTAHVLTHALEALGSAIEVVPC